MISTCSFKIPYYIRSPNMAYNSKSLPIWLYNSKKEIHSYKLLTFVENYELNHR